MNWLNLKSITVTIIVAFAVGLATYLIQQQTANQLRAENQKLGAIEQALTNERDDALAAATGSAAELKRRQSDKDELLRLRGEVGQLRKRAKETELLAEQNRALQEALARTTQSAPKTEVETDPESRFAMEQSNESRQLLLGLIMYASDHQGMLPTNLTSISNYFGAASTINLQSSPFELVLQGPLKNVANPAEVIAVRSQSTFIWKDKPAKVYGFADGHSEVKREPEEGFEAWEKARIIPAPTGQ